MQGSSQMSVLSAFHMGKKYLTISLDVHIYFHVQISAFSTYIYTVKLFCYNYTLVHTHEEQSRT